MNVRWIESGTTVGAPRGDTVVCVIGDVEHELLVGCLKSVLAHTAGDVQVVLWLSGDLLELALRLDVDREMLAVAVPLDGPAPRQLEVVARFTAPADVVLLRPRCIVGNGWLEGLRAAAYGDAQIATATALATREWAVPVPAGATPDVAAAEVRHASQLLRPRLEHAGRACVYVRRSAIELAGLADPGAGGDGAGAFSDPWVERGLCHVLADDVLVMEQAGADVGSRPYASPRVSRAVGIARKALVGVSVAIDARNLSGPMNGTKLHVLELISALAGTSRATVTAIVPDDFGPEPAALLSGVSGLALVRASEAASHIRADLVHRPFQISAPADLAFLARISDRLVITHQDLISYRTPTYFSSSASWEGYRAMTRTALCVADHVVFFSAHARDDALSEELVEFHRASVIRIGVDHALVGAEAPSTPPGVEQLPPEADLMLCLGADFRHKNREFALRLVDELQRRHGWTGSLVLAGPHVALGSSLDDERVLLERAPRLATAVVQLGEVTEPEKAWLLDRAKLAVYPTVYEGFGLIPFEAADHDVPCLWAPGTALSEMLPDASAGIVPWDAAASAELAIDLMRNRDAAVRNVQAVREAARALRWSSTANQLIDLYERVCDEPPSPAGLAERASGAMHESLSEDAVRLVGPGGALPRELERPLLALAMRPALSAPVFGLLKAGYMASQRLRRASAERQQRYARPISNR